MTAFVAFVLAFGGLYIFPLPAIWSELARDQ
jgi:hypothetical protein